MGVGRGRLRVTRRRSPVSTPRRRLRFSRTSSRGTSRGPRRRAREVEAEAEEEEEEREIRRIPATKRRTRACPTPRRISSRVCCIRTLRSVLGRGPARRTSRRTRSSPESTGIRCSRTACGENAAAPPPGADLPVFIPSVDGDTDTSYFVRKPKVAGSQSTSDPLTGAGNHLRRRSRRHPWVNDALQAKQPGRHQPERIAPRVALNMDVDPEVPGSIPPRVLAAAVAHGSAASELHRHQARLANRRDRGGRPWGRPP